MSGKTDLYLLKKIRLNNFNMVMAFSGWSDAKRIATYAAEYLRDKLRAEKIGEINSKNYYDFAIQRPLVSIKKGLMKEYMPPSNELYVWKGKDTDHDLLILIGVEPHTSWTKYVESIFDALDLEEINRICLLGGLIDRIPHTIDPLISGVASTPELVGEMRLGNIEPADYDGPSSIHSLILNESIKKKIPAISIWGHAPEYITDIDPNTTYRLLDKVKAMIGLEIDLEELHMEGNLFKKKLDSLMKQDRTFAELVHRLEIDYKNAKRTPDYLT
ncbi:MAG: PAC2 family protein [Candidatus Bathyarchaeota archaeon]|nr:PAC2 family protein [Candidatus Bathyarchaeota archaeon]